MNKATQLLNSGDAQVIDIEYMGGTSMPRHIATSDAYLVIEKGTALLIYQDHILEINKDIVAVIPANEQHMLKVIEDLKGYIILINTAEINYISAEKIQN